MPELPEVEAWRRGLEAWWTGRRVVAVEAVDASVVRPALSTRPSDAMAGGEAWLRSLVGRRVGPVSRVGKRLGLRFEAGDDVVHALLHLGMTGRFEQGAAPPAAARFGLAVEGAHPVWFVDPRRFGCVAPLADPASLSEGLGPDAWHPWTGSELATRLPGRRPVKVALLDQEALAGLGNIHAAEALWRAGIAPTRSCASLSVEEWATLAEAVFLQLDRAVSDIPAELGDFVYVSEGGPNPFAVYGREGRPCPRCGDAVARVTQGGRGTWWCPSCQPA